MRLTWLGHACFCLEGSRTILIDPFIPEDSLSVEPDIVAVTHAHADHLGIAAELSKKTVAVNEVAKYLRSKGVPTEPMNIGGSITVDGVQFTMTPALHSSWLEDEGMGFYGGAAAGFVIAMDGISVYHAGDTALFSDMQLIRDLYRPDVALLPVGGRFTMGPDEAMIAARYTGARLVIPMHYDTFPAIRQDLQNFKQAIERTTAIRVRILSPAESIEIGPESPET
ncbi:MULTISPECIES: metal-dependent hydrolase [unclassified Methanoculleus]|uniref:metal-dependent hydrolase n=1 Tax=unclassified Methanoculleus TaxID=2619537 RepID=UPI0025E9D088|nr:MULTISPECIES: metal-dependent hydrolase [unclassified Methanoculleus]MCK9318620.1 metal-dependent hydrolase [Methanoculleus sp.]MDD2254011.1 metal-dependent hydrolase [Methanoculleus sp.]MDD2788603.1 metal-dependent hydrolase [Methanoculleus sp.]MDD3216871.1 metal-dependent hydrolase [Methanoculleus sp.]MDD4314989.1 metal-dependent hydrolase [Methanoculleus sp.]